MTDLQGSLLCPKAPHGWWNNLITSRYVGGKNTKVRTSSLTAGQLWGFFFLPFTQIKDKDLRVSRS